MPPDADSTRQRKNASALIGNGNGIIASASPAEQRIVSSVKSLKSNEVAIDGIIYTLDGFDHPGGDSIHMFGGNDVTVQYKMIHPRHEASRVQKKLKRVGTIPDYVCDYKFDTPFEKEVKEKVFNIVKRGEELGTWGWHVRAAFYTSCLFVIQYLWTFHGSTTWLAVAYGIIQALIGLNVQHDANHGAASKNVWINELYGCGADLIGGSKWLWMEQHWTHHAYTNDDDKDPDTDGAKPLVLFHPSNEKDRSMMHQFQIYYTSFVLSLYWLSSLFNPAHFDLKHRGALEKGMKMESKYITSRRKYAYLLRMYYVGITYVSPFYHHSDSNKLTALLHIIIMGSIGSLFLGILFSVSHNFENVERYPVEQDEPVCWFTSQAETSCTYGGHIAGYITGGLNFQIEHHLFPRMSSSWYPTIAPIVRDVCQKHNVRYTYYPTLWENLWSAIKYIHAVGTGSSTLLQKQKEHQE